MEGGGKRTRRQKDEDIDKGLDMLTANNGREGVGSDSEEVTS
jgi:hypothetical protein